MARLACLREAGLRVVRIGRLLKIRQVTSRAGCRSSRELSSLMARRALQVFVRSGQIKAGLLQVIELGVQPGICVMALFAGRGKAAGHVIGLCVLVVLGVTGITLGGQALELPNRCTLVA